MAARLAPENVRRMHQSLHHLVADAPWSDEEMLRSRSRIVGAMQQHDPVVAWIVDDTGFPKRGCTPWAWRTNTAANWGSRKTAV